MVRECFVGRTISLRAITWGCLLLVAPGMAYSQPVSSRDSMGVRIVENRDPVGLSANLRLGAAPSLRLGRSEGGGSGELVPSILRRRVAQLSDGRWIVTDPNRIQVFARNGTPVAIWGRKGSGPGEYEEIAPSLCILPGDTIQVEDNRLRRVTRLAPDGRVVATHSTADARSIGECVLPRGERLFGKTVTGAGESGTRLPVEIHRAAVDGRNSVRLGVLFHDPYSGSMLGQADAAVMQWGDLLVVAHGRKAEVRLHDAATEALRRVIRTGTVMAPVTKADIDRAVSQLAPPGGRPPEDMVRRIREQSPPAWPAYARAELDRAAGGLWLQDGGAWPGRSPNWTLYDLATGAAAGRLALPARFAVRDPDETVVGFHGGRLVTQGWNDDGAWELRFYPILGLTGR